MVREIQTCPSGEDTLIIPGQNIPFTVAETHVVVHGYAGCSCQQIELYGALSFLQYGRIGRIEDDGVIIVVDDDGESVTPADFPSPGQWSLRLKGHGDGDGTFTPVIVGGVQGDKSISDRVCPAVKEFEDVLGLDLLLKRYLRIEGMPLSAVNAEVVKIGAGFVQFQTHCKSSRWCADHPGRRRRNGLCRFKEFGRMP